MEDNASYQYWKAQIYLQMKELKKARQAIVKAQENRPWNKRYVELHARIERANGNNDLYQQLIDRLVLLDE